MPEQKLFIIDDDTSPDLYMPGQVKVDGITVGHGLVPRDYSKFPVGYMGPLCPPMQAVEMPLIPKSDWSAIIKEKKAARSRLSDIRRNALGTGKPMPSLQQLSSPYCWGHSGTMALMLIRALANLPYKRLSAFAVCCKVMNFQLKGGWGAGGLEYIIEHGVPDVDHWKESSTSRSNDTPETWANAALYKVTSAWMDLEPPVYDRDLSWDQVGTCLLNNCPVIADFNHWQHSVALMDLAEIEPGDFGVLGINSWGDQYGDLGEFVLRGSKARPDGASSARVATAA